MHEQNENLLTVLKLIFLFSCRIEIPSGLLPLVACDNENLAF